MVQEGNICIFMGPPGSGKGSLSQLCSQELKIDHLSTGNLCRSHIENQTKIGKKIDLLIKSGKLIDDCLMSKMVYNWLQENVYPFSYVILDGFPRTVRQAELFVEYLQKDLLLVQNIQVVKLSISSTSVINRLCNRYVCENKDCQRVYSLLVGSSCAPKISFQCDTCSCTLIRRSDDCKATIEKRLKIYESQEKDLLSFFECSGGKVETINADRPLQEVFSDIKKQLFTEKKT